MSSDVAELRDYEKVLLRSYEDCLASLGKWLRGSPAQRVAAVRGLCALLTKGRDFNAIHKIIEMLVPVCNWKVTLHPTPYTLTPTLTYPTLNPKP